MYIPDTIKGKKILIVDDVPSMRGIVRAFLKEVGFFKITTANDGKDAMQKIHRVNYDLIICDWNMPGLSGLEILQALRADDQMKSTNFMMVTASSESEKVKQAINSGIDGYIIKPFKANILYEKILAIFSSGCAEQLESKAS